MGFREALKSGKIDLDEVNFCHIKCNKLFIIFTNFTA